MLRVFLFFIFCFSFSCVFSQDLEYGRKVLESIASPSMFGRGYVKDGDRRAADYIRLELKHWGASSFTLKYFQELSYPINTFPSSMQVELDGDELKAGLDYVVSPDCNSIKGKYELAYLPAAADTNDILFDSISKLDYVDKFVVIPFNKRKISNNNLFKAAGLIYLKPSISWWASNGHSVSSMPALFINDSLFKKQPKQIVVDIKNKFYKTYRTQNVIGYIPGTEQADSFVVFTAHYDHLGMMGSGNVFPGANDNASGTAMVLDLVRHYSLNRPKYTMIFIFFTGEEAGLLGSGYFVQHPLFKLTNAKVIINLDMVGSGSEGIGVVNGKELPEITNRMKAINDQHQYLQKLNIRKNACNSDHCFFAQQGLPAIFIYTQGPEHKAYHSLDDTPDILPFTKYNELFKLLVELVK